jgi:hypothetical protein
MEIKQIALSPDGNYIYAVDAEGKLWFAPTREPHITNLGVIAVKPDWKQIAAPAKPRFLSGPPK